MNTKISLEDYIKISDLLKREFDKFEPQYKSDIFYLVTYKNLLFILKRVDDVTVTSFSVRGFKPKSFSLRNKVIRINDLAIFRMWSAEEIENGFNVVRFNFVLEFMPL